MSATRLRAAALVLVLLPLTALLGACSTYDAYYRYGPSPASATVDEDGRSLLHVLASVRGLRSEQGRTLLDVVARVENRDERTWSVDPATARLVASSLLRFELFSTEPADARDVAGGATEDLALTFALAQGLDADDVDLGGLNLTLDLVRDGATRVVSLGFDRERAEYYGPDPYFWDPWWYGRPWSRWRVGYWHRW